MTDTPAYGTPVQLAPDLRVVLAPNPSPMTQAGTNTYLLGQTDITVIDPGPDISAHLDAILQSLAPGARIAQILVTHAHLDHSPLSRALSARTGAPVLAFGDVQAGRSKAMLACIEAGLSSGGEGLDLAFAPNRCLHDGETLEAADSPLTAWHTPGHMGNHMCFEWRDVVFCGDLVMGWASSLVSPPDGDLTDFMASCTKLRSRKARVLYSGHGAPITEPDARIDWLITHRKSREAQILDALESGPANAHDLATRIYTETPSALIPAATRNVFAHLIDLEGKQQTRRLGTPTEDTRFERV